MKYMGLLRAIIKSLALLTIVAWLLLKLRMNFIEGVISRTVFALIGGCVIGGALAFVMRGCFREIQKLKEDERSERGNMQSDDSASATVLRDEDKQKATPYPEPVHKYIYSRLLASLMLLLSILLFGLPYFSAAPGQTVQVSVYVIVFAVAVSVLSSAIYFFAYSITIDKERGRLIVGVFAKREFLLGEMVAINVSSSGRFQHAVLTFRTGEHVNINANLRGFDDLLRRLKG